MDSFIAVVLGLTFWLAAIVSLQEGWRYAKIPGQKNDSGNKWEAGARFALGILLFIMGVYSLATSISSLKIILMIIAPVCLLVCRWSFRRYRKNWKKFSEGGHRNEVLANLATIIFSGAAGLLILWFGVIH